MRLITIAFLSLMILNSCGQGLKKVEIRYPNGQLKIEGTTLKGKRQGISKTYYESGQQKTQNNWDNDIQVGKTTHWFENGIMEFEGQLENGYESGEWKYYDKRDGEYIYSVFYEKGEVVDYKFINDKYRWGTVEIDNFLISLDFPSFLMDSISVPNVFDGYWTMFPWIRKNDIEFYSIAKTPLGISKKDFDMSMQNLNEEQKEFLNILYHNAVTDPTIPNFNVDKYEIAQSEHFLIGENEAYRLNIRFTDYEVDLNSVLVPLNNDLYIVSAFFHKNVNDTIRTKYFNSIVIKN